MPINTIQKPKNTEPVTPAPEQEHPQDLPHAATIDLIDVAPSSVIERRVKLTDTAMMIAPETTFEEAVSLYDFTHTIRERGRWWLGDIVNFMEDHFPEKYSQAIDLSGLSYSRLTTICSVCRRIEPSRRRQEVSFTWHEKIAYLAPQSADYILDRGIKEKWTNEQFEDSVARAKGEPTKAEKKAAKEAKPGSTAAKVAASGIKPQIPEGEKPLIWNGYPLRVGKPYEGANERIVFQGNEPLEDTETERAAHENKFAHKEAMMNWLEEHNFIKTEGGETPCAAPASPTTTPKIETALSTEAASNGAAPNATESAPTPHIGPEVMLAMGSVPTWNGEAVYAKDGLLWVKDRWMNAPEADQCANAHGFIYAEQMVKALERATVPAPAAPPASPEPPVSADIAKTMQAVIDGLQLDVKKLREDREEERSQMAEIMAEMGAHPSSHNTGEKAMMEVKNIWQSLRIERDEAIKKRDADREQLACYEEQASKKPPLQRAEEALRAFNTAAPEITDGQWAEIGSNKLLRLKWLENLLFTADEVIDKIQAHPIAARK